MQHNSFFHIGYKIFYRQINSSTMASYDAQLTYNNALLYHEFQLLQDPIMKSNILNYSRYIDDGFCITYDSQTEVFQIIDCMKRHLPSDINVEFNIQKFKINYLDLWITVAYGLKNMCCTITMKTQDYFQIMSLLFTMYHDQTLRSLVWRKKINKPTSWRLAISQRWPK